MTIYNSLYIIYLVRVIFSHLTDEFRSILTSEEDLLSFMVQNNIRLDPKDHFVAIYYVGDIINIVSFDELRQNVKIDKSAIIIKTKEIEEIFNESKQICC